MILVYLLAAYLAIGVVAGAAAAGDDRGPHPVAARRVPAVALRGGALAQGARPLMKRAHRLVHRALWPALAVAVALVFGLAFALRPPLPPDETPAAETQTP